MSIEITFGYWVIPLLVTIFSHSYAEYKSPKSSSDAYGIDAIFSLGLHLTALSVSLIAWLVWSLAT